jgi:hypothetical protein
MKLIMVNLKIEGNKLSMRQLEIALTEHSDPTIYPGYRHDFVEIWAKRRGRGNYKWELIVRDEYFFPFHQPSFSPEYVYRVVLRIHGS